MEKLTEHDQSKEHKSTVLAHARKISGKDTIEKSIKAPPANEKDMVTLRCIAWNVDHKFPVLSSTAATVQLLRDHGVPCRPGSSHSRNNHLSRYSITEMVAVGGEELRASAMSGGTFADAKWQWMIKTLFPKGMPISIQGDGSLDTGLDEKEALLLRFLGKCGRPEVI